MKQKVCVLLATFNGELWLKEQVQSIFEQDGVDVHVFVSDDASSDGTVGLIKEMQSMYPTLYLLKESGRFGSAGQNFFRLIREVDFTNFDFVALCDQDDVWFRDKLKKATAQINTHGCVGYSAAVTAFWEGGKEQNLVQSRNITPIDYFFEGAGQGCTFVLERSFAEQAQQLLKLHENSTKEIHYHDWSIYAISRTLGYSWYFDNQPCMLYRQHTQNDTGARGALGGVVKRVDLIRRGWYANQIKHILSLVLAISPSSVAANELKSDRYFGARGLLGRFGLALRLIQIGRRKFSDRAVLAFAAIAGYLV